MSGLLQALLGQAAELPEPRLNERKQTLSLVNMDAVGRYIPLFVYDCSVVTLHLSVRLETVGPDLSQRLGEVWTDGLQAYREMERDHRTVVHKERYVSPDGVHINQAECLFSLVQPWLRKFRRLSKQGSEQATHTVGIVRSLTLVGESVDLTIDCLVIGAFHSST